LVPLSLVWLAGACTAIDDPFGWRVAAPDAGGDAGAFDAATDGTTSSSLLCTPGTLGQSACADKGYTLCDGFEGQFEPRSYPYTDPYAPATKNGATGA
jgi:hypothetical protein